MRFFRVFTPKGTKTTQHGRLPLWLSAVQVLPSDIRFPLREKLRMALNNGSTVIKDSQSIPWGLGTILLSVSLPWSWTSTKPKVFFPLGFSCVWNFPFFSVLEGERLSYPCPYTQLICFTSGKKSVRMRPKVSAHLVWTEVGAVIDLCGLTALSKLGSNCWAQVISPQHSKQWELRVSTIVPEIGEFVCM